MSSRFRIVVLCDDWGAAGASGSAGAAVATSAVENAFNVEKRVLLRQIAGVLALKGDVFVVSIRGREPSQHADGAFEVFELATRSDRAAVKRQLLLWTLCTQTDGVSLRVDARSRGPKDSIPDEARRWLRDTDDEAWGPAAEVVRALAPDLLVVAGLGNRALSAAIDRAAPNAPVVQVPMVADTDPMLSFDAPPILERAQDVLVATRAEQHAVSEHLSPSRVGSLHTIGVSLPVFDAVWREPVTAVAHTDYVAVLCNSRAGKANALVSKELQVIVNALPERPVSAIFNDHLDVWTRGSCNRVVPFTGETDLGRLLAWARVTVDLRPGRLFARASLISLRYGTPIVVPELSRAKQHAEDGGCGLWYRDGAEMLEGLSLLLDESKGTRLGKSGALYTKEHFGSPSLFRDRTLAALRGINDESAPTEVLQG